MIFRNLFAAAALLGGALLASLLALLAPAANAQANHVENFLTCVRNRQQPISPAEVGHRSASMCHLAVIAMDVGKKLDWDPVAERFGNSDEANRMRSRPMRSPWHL